MISEHRADGVIRNLGGKPASMPLGGFFYGAIQFSINFIKLLT
jgi:hypothetical protein